MEAASGGAQEAAPGALSKLILRHPSGSSAEVYHLGAHVTSWRLSDGEEVLFMSRKSRFEPGVPIRGGIPLVFPQFSKRGSLPQHGFARTESWELTEEGVSDAGAVFLRLSLCDSPATRSLWPHPFRAELLVSLDSALTTALSVSNTGDAPFTFTTALHTYFAVGDVRTVRVEGLGGARFLGTEPGGEPQPAEETVRIDRETDGVYDNVADLLQIRDASRHRTLLLEKEGFADAVVWNPWIDKARAMPDFGDEEYLTMLCVEPGNIAEPIRLEPGQRWTGTQTLRVEPES